MPNESLSLDAGAAGTRPSLVTPDDPHERRSRPPLRLIAPPPPLAPATTPLSAPIGTFERHRLVAAGHGRLEFVDTGTERLFHAVLVITGALLAAIGLSRLGSALLAPAGEPSSLATLSPGDPSIWGPLLIAAILLSSALATARAGGHMIFDGQAREFRRSRGAAGALLSRVPFDELAGVQSLACRVADEEVTWSLHQINLVRRDGSRVHVCSHVEESRARRNAETIARFIGVEMLASGNHAPSTSHRPPPENETAPATG